MLPVSLDCPFSLPLRYSSTFICHVSCVPYVASFFKLSIFDCPFGILSHLFVLCLVYPMVTVSLDCPFVIAPSVFSSIYLSCVLCTLCCQFLWIFLFLLFLFVPSVFSNIYLSCVLCTLCYQFLWVVLFYCPFGIL